MADYALDATVRVHPFEHNRDGDDVIIGDPARDAYLCIPADGLDLLESLAAGNTVAETVRTYQDKYGETPDIEDFIGILTDEGFIAPDTEADTEAGDGEHGHAHSRRGTARVRKSWSFDWISPSVAARLCGAPVLIAAGLFIALGTAVAVTHPQQLPTVKTLLFPHGYFAALTMGTLALAICAVMLHEFAHAVVARSAGLPARLALGNLMYTIVAQTDITGIWMAPKRKRYLAFLSGTIVDLVAASAIVDLIYAESRGWVSLNQTWLMPLLNAFLFTYAMRISFQLLFYLRTDIYYVVSTAMSCKSLMSDTETFLRNKVFRALRRPHRVVDQSGIPAREMKRVRVYAAFYAIGRVFWIAVLSVFYLPLLWSYVDQFILLVTGHPHRLGAIDFLTIAFLAFLLDGGGLVMWLRGIYRNSRAKGSIITPATPALAALAAED
ncbi:MAG TPA: hypothetical protein VFU73_10810 [Actinocrinis sp.]|nr:hypothetical protein [Actinocrinis sp.]